MEREQVGDIEFQMMSKMLEVNHPKLFCPSEKEVTNLCINPKCKHNALFCQSDHCPSCSQPHLACENVRLKVITKLLQQQAQNQRQILMQLFEIENARIKKFKQARKLQIQKCKLGISESKFSKIINQLYINQKNIDFSPTVAGELFSSIRQINNLMKEKASALLKQFQKQTDKIFSELTHLQEHIINQLSFGNGWTNTFQNSAILSISSKKDLQSIQFINDSLNHPKKLQLLFRASQHGFLASEFHQKCENVPHTFILIKTEFGKIIAGYTPLLWNAEEKSRFVQDKSQASFLLSIDLKQKLRLVVSDQAIRCNRNWGPIFGAGWDIGISDKCNKNNCTANIPASYANFLLSKNNQDTHTAFSGAPNGYNFKVVEYEVYKVIW